MLTEYQHHMKRNSPITILNRPENSIVSSQVSIFCILNVLHLCVSVSFCYPQGVGADPHIAFALPPESKLVKAKAEEPSFPLPDSDEMTIRIGRAGPLSGKPPFIYPHQLLQHMLE